MKLINKYLTLLLSLSLFTACDFMDCDESDNLCTSKAICDECLQLFAE